jgi:hypothetical protein
MREIDQTADGPLDAGPPEFGQDGWRRACNAQHDCVEVQAISSVVGVRDSKSAAAAALAFGWPTWNGFLTHVTT